MIRFRSIYRVISIIVFVSTIWSNTVMAKLGSDTVSVMIDNEAVVFDDNYGYPFIDENNRTLVPFRIVLETFGATVSWDNESRTAIAEYNDIEIMVPIGMQYIYVDGEILVIDTAAVIKDGRTYLPIRAVMENFGATVGWSGELREVYIDRAPREAPIEDPEEDPEEEPVVPILYDMTVGMDSDEFISTYGDPDVILPSSYGFDWWIYRNDYDAYFQVGVDRGTVQAIYTTNDLTGWSYDVTVGQSSDKTTKLVGPVRDGAVNIWTYNDPNGGYTVDSVLVISQTYDQKQKMPTWNDPEMVNSYEQQLAELVNTYRVKHGKNALVFNDALAAVSREHSEDMAVRNYFSHTTPEGVTYVERIEQGGIEFSNQGENLAAGHFTPIRTFNAWLNSEGHRNIILGDFDEFGIGIYFDSSSDKYGSYYTQMLIAN